jgi:hypothetical protein
VPSEPALLSLQGSTSRSSGLRRLVLVTGCLATLACRAERSASSLPPAATARTTPAQARGPVPTRLHLGEGWGCAEFETPLGSTVECWDAPLSEAGPPRAWTVPWLKDKHISSGPDRVCELLRPEGSFRCWSRPERGQAAPQELDARGEWVPPPLGTAEAAAEQVDRAGGVAIGGTFACLQAAGDGDDHVFCRGDDRFGQLGGSGSQNGAPARSSYVPGIAPALWLNAGTWHACAIANTVSDDHRRYVHRVACWGRGDYGQLSAPAPDRCEANGTEVGCAKTPVMGIELSDLASFAIGDLYTCINGARGISCWGANRDGFFGEPGSCPASLKSAWPTLRGSVPAPRAACSTKPLYLPHVFETQSWVQGWPARSLHRRRGGRALFRRHSDARRRYFKPDAEPRARCRRLCAHG